MWTEVVVSVSMFSWFLTEPLADVPKVIKGRFQAKQLENVLRKYIIDYVTCRTCRSPETSLSKGENRLYFITCNCKWPRRPEQGLWS